MIPDAMDAYTPLVARVLKIQDITQGELKSNYLVRYRGTLTLDAAQAYDQLAADLKPMDITPLVSQRKRTGGGAAHARHDKPDRIQPLG